MGFPNSPKYTVFKEKSLGKGFNISPFQTEAPESDEYEIERKWDYNGKIYKTNAFYPASNVMIKELGSWRGRRMLELNVYPVRYNPVTTEIRALESLEFYLEYDGKIDLNGEEEKRKHVLFRHEKIMANFIDNYKPLTLPENANNVDAFLFSDGICPVCQGKESDTCLFCQYMNSALQPQSASPCYYCANAPTTAQTKSSSSCNNCVLCMHNPPDLPGYVIVIADALYPDNPLPGLEQQCKDTVDQFAMWKRKKGNEVLIIKVSECDLNSDNTVTGDEVRDLLKSYYSTAQCTSQCPNTLHIHDNGDICFPNLYYVLLLGDATRIGRQQNSAYYAPCPNATHGTNCIDGSYDVISTNPAEILCVPSHMGGVECIGTNHNRIHHAIDHPYSDLDGAYNYADRDAIVARISTDEDSPTDARRDCINILTKILHYDESPEQIVSGATNWYKRALAIGYYEDQTNGINDGIVDTGYAAETIATAYRFLKGESATIDAQLPIEDRWDASMLLGHMYPPYTPLSSWSFVGPAYGIFGAYRTLISEQHWGSDVNWNASLTYCAPDIQGYPYCMNSAVSIEMCPSQDSIGTASAIASYLEEGAGLVMFRGHGVRDAWSRSPFNTERYCGAANKVGISDVMNGESTPVVVSLCCQTGNFTEHAPAYEACFAEEFLRHNESGGTNGLGGAVGVIAYTSTGYQSISTATLYGMLTAFYGGRFDSNAICEPSTYNLTWGVAESLLLARYIMDENSIGGGSAARKALLAYFGDPEMALRTDNPRRANMYRAFSRITLGGTPYWLLAAELYDENNAILSNAVLAASSSEKIHRENTSPALFLLEIYDDANEIQEYELVGTAHNIIPDVRLLCHSADVNCNWKMDFLEKLQVMAMTDTYSNGYSMCPSEEAGYTFGGDNSAFSSPVPHDSDLNGDWHIDQSEWDRFLELAGSNGYKLEPEQLIILPLCFSILW